MSENGASFPSTRLGSPSDRLQPRRLRQTPSDEDSGDGSPRAPSKRGRKSRDTDGDASPAKAKAKANGRAPPKLSDEECCTKARLLVRLALANELTRKPLKRDDIGKKVLGIHNRSFNAVYTIAQDMLRHTFGLELVELPPKVGAAPSGAPEAADDIKLSGGKGASKKSQSNVHAPRASKRANAVGNDRDIQKVAVNEKPFKASGPKQYILRSRLPTDWLVAACTPPATGSIVDGDEVEVEPDRGGSDDGVPHDVRPGHGLHKSMDVDETILRDWRQDDGALFDWKRGDQLPQVGIIYVILSLILVNARRCADDQLHTFLKRLGLRALTVVPCSPATAPDTANKLTLDKFLVQLTSQGYLEKVVNKRIASASAHEGSTMGDAATDWLWGPRAFAEIGEDAVCRFILEFCKAPNTADAAEIDKFQKKWAKDISIAAGSDLQSARQEKR